MIEIPQGKFCGTFRDPALGEVLKSNKPLREAFEQAAKVKMGFAYGQIQIFADKKEDLSVIQSTLQELADELKKIPEDRFYQIIGKMGKTL